EHTRIVGRHTDHGKAPRPVVFRRFLDGYAPGVLHVWERVGAQTPTAGGEVHAEGQRSEVPRVCARLSDRPSPRLRVLLRPARGRLPLRGPAGHVTRERIAAGPPSIWRYQDLLPIDGPREGEAAIGQHVAFTPLVRARNLAEELGVRELYVKNDSV